VVVKLPTAGKDASLINGTLNHLNLKLEKVKKAGGEDSEADKPKIGDSEDWSLTHSKVFAVSEQRVIDKVSFPPSPPFLVRSRREVFSPSHSALFLIGVWMCMDACGCMWGRGKARAQASRVNCLSSIHTLHE